MMYSSGGLYPVGSWRCQRCDAGSGEVIRKPGDLGGELREAAVAHLQRYGHDVTFMTGTREELSPMRTEVSWQADAGASVLADGDDWPPERP